MNETTTPLLPAGFAELEPLCARWAVPASPTERYLLRQSCDMDELRGFYALVQPRVSEILDHVDGFPMDAPLPDAEQRLYNLALALTEVALAVEIYGQPGVPHARKPHMVTVEFGRG